VIARMEDDMKKVATPARFSTAPPGVAGAAELQSRHALGGADFSLAIGRRVALLFGEQLMQRVAARRAQADTEATHGRSMSPA
jgi:hypothetical protein